MCDGGVDTHNEWTIKYIREIIDVHAQPEIHPVFALVVPVTAGYTNYTLN